MSSENACYGKMFPCVASMGHNQTTSGEVFGYRVDVQGLVVQRREAIVDRRAWNKCMQCLDAESCYRLSTGKLLMELALQGVPQTFY